MAFGRSSRSSTISTTNACRAGVSNALIDPLHELQHDDLGHGDHVRQRQHRQRERLQHRQHLRDDENAMAVPPVDEHAGEWARARASESGRRTRRRRGAARSR